MRLTLSIIIPHLNQEEYLRRCIASLQTELGERQGVEVIVVDNGSKKLPSDLSKIFPNVLLVEEAMPGPGMARNKGVAISGGRLLAFIDADCTAHPGWIATIQNALSVESSYSIIGGDVKIALSEPPHMTSLEAYESVFAYRQKEYIEKMGFSGTGNLAMCRSVYDAVGPFKGIEVAEDREWGQRATKLGYTIGYEPNMVVYHPARGSIDELYRKWDRHIAHDYELYAKGRFGKLRWLVRALAIGLSPGFELYKVMRSTRIRGMSNRLAACYVLLRVRLYRCRQMLKATFNASHINAGAWNRNP